MKKSLPTDAQVILVIMRTQEKIAEILGTDTEKDEKVAEDERLVDLLTLYIIQISMLLKGLSKKSKEVFTFVDAFKSKLVLDSLGTCFPMVGSYDIVTYARSLATDVACQTTKNQYEVCIKKSDNYDAH